MTSENRNCHICQTQFTIEPEDFIFYEKLKVPAPVNCPECRFKWRCQFRNEITLYKRTCDLCQKSIISMYNPASPYIVYCHSCWESDKWDPNDYALDYDESKPFYDQLGELLKKVPKKATYTSSGAGPNINSDYTNVAGGNKNCYLIFNSGKNEDALYSRGLVSCRDSSDLYYGGEGEQSYELINFEQTSKVAYGDHINGSFNSWFVYDISGCSNCFGVVNARHQKNNFFGESLSEEEFKNRADSIKGSYAKIEETKKEFEDYALQFPRKENHNFKAIDCTGDYIVEAKNVKESFEIMEAEKCKYIHSIKFSKDSYDSLGYGYSTELILECVGVGYSSRVIGTYWADNCQDIGYSYAMTGSNNCFGCDGLKKASYCILNKQYSEEEYQKIREKIITELKQKNLYGLFMPPQLAPFGYNETFAQNNFPITKEEAEAQGFRWEDDIHITRGQETIKSKEIPDHIKDVSDDILKEVLACVDCGRNYRLIPAELKFYREMTIPVPRRCFQCRHQERVKRRGPYKLFNRTCAQRTKNIKTTYAPDRPEIVYCESCYQSEVA